MSSTDALRSTRALADVLAQDANPKMRNSQFLQFVSKMSRGELMFEDNKVGHAAGELSCLRTTRWVMRQGSSCV